MTGEDIIALYDGHAREIVGFLARRTGDPQLALDLTAETFLTAVEQRERCRAETHRQRLAWVHRIAANELADHYRHGAKERRLISRLGVELRALTDSERTTIKELAGSDGLEESVGAALEKLSAEQQAAVRLHVIEERSYAEVSRELGVSQPAARARVSRGLRALRRATERHEREGT
jgi:RNA polymerase sigma factor (sigma-70 family)